MVATSGTRGPGHGTRGSRNPRTSADSVRSSNLLSARAGCMGFAWRTPSLSWSASGDQSPGLGWGRELPLLVGLDAIVLTGAVLTAVHHADVVAHRVGEPFGPLVVAVAVIEVGLIVTLMVSPAGRRPRHRPVTRCSPAGRRIGRGNSSRACGSRSCRAMPGVPDWCSSANREASVGGTLPSAKRRQVSSWMWCQRASWSESR